MQLEVPSSGICLHLNLSALALWESPGIHFTPKYFPLDSLKRTRSFKGVPFEKLTLLNAPLHTSPP